MSGPVLMHEVECVVCGCWHVALDHHGIDRDPRSGGCFGSGSGHPWSPVPKCACIRTASDVLAEGGETQ